MDVEQPNPLLGGLSAQQFMRRHWQKKPLLVRQALPGVQPPLGRSALFALAAQEGVESRLIVREGTSKAGWSLRHGPLPRRALPPLNQKNWTLLLQGLDLHVPAAHKLLARFRFVPEARLDDLMISYASDGGGVGPHVDAYDVFLVQVQGRRRWRYGRCADDQIVDGLPLKILRHFEPEHEAVLEPGDLLYLPPGWAHDGIAEGECMTCSVGFRAASGEELAAAVLTRLADAVGPQGAHDKPPKRYRDPAQPATAEPGRIPAALQDFACAAVERELRGPSALHLALGEVLTEPKANVWFDAGTALQPGHALRLDARSRMMYDERHVYINGESFRAGGRDARLMASLADARRLDAKSHALLSADAQDLLQSWARSGWVHEDHDDANTSDHLTA